MAPERGAFGVRGLGVGVGVLLTKRNILGTRLYVAPERLYILVDQ